MFNGSNGYSLADIAAATGTNGNGGFGGWGDGAWWIIVLLLFANGGWGNGNGNNGTTAVVGREISYGFDMNNIENGIRGIQNGLCDGFYAMNTGLLNSTAQLQSTMAQGFGGVTSAIATSTFDTQKGFYDNALANIQNTNVITGQLRDFQAQEAACCCETQRLIDKHFCDLNYRMATDTSNTQRIIADSTRDIVDNQNAGVRAILEFLTEDKIANLQAENQALKLAQSQSNQNAFLISQLAPKAIPAYLAPNPYTGQYYAGGYNSCYAALNTGCGCGALA